MKKNLIIIVFVFLGILCSEEKGNGLSHQTFFDGYCTSIHVLTVDPNEYAIKLVKAVGEVVQRETVSTLANRYGAIAAINGGFWKSNGDPAGILKIRDHWYATPIKPRGAIGWSENGKKVLMDRVLTNRNLNDRLYGEIEVIPFSEHPDIQQEEWRKMEYIVGGAPLLVKNGMIIRDYRSEQILPSFLTKNYARTAVGITSHGEWIFVVVDGSLFGLAGGMTIKQLAEFMFNLGCIEALNLDGGGSSTMVIEGSVVNDPYGNIQEEGKRVKAVSDAILILSHSKENEG